MSDKINQINKIKELIGSDSNIVKEIGKYCEHIKNKSKIQNMKSYVLKKIDKTYDTHIIDKYLDNITNLKHKVRDNTKDCYHDIKIHTSFKINEILIDFKCQMDEDHENNFIINIDGKTIIDDEEWGMDYPILKKDNDITNFNLQHYHKLDVLTHTCAQYGWVNEKKEDKIQKFIEIKDKQKFLYFYSNGELCMYGNAPCSNYKIDGLKKDTIFSYSLYFKN